MRGGMIRAVQEQNADWYRAFCDRYQSNRRRMRSKSDTKIKRQHTRRALNELIAGECRTYYAERVRDFIYWWVESERQRRQSAA